MIQRGHCRRRVTEASSTHDKLDGHFTPGELESSLRPAMVLERAGNDGNSDRRPEGDACCRRSDQNRIWIPCPESPDSGVKGVNVQPRRICAGQHCMQVPTADRPNEVRILAQGDDSLRGEYRLDM